MKYLKYFSLFISLIIASASLQAHATNNPYQLVRDVSEKLFNRVKVEQTKINTDKNYLKVIVEEELLPYTDYKYAAYKILGKTLKKTSKEQREAFVEVFREYLITTYASVFTLYNNQRFEFEPIQAIDNKKKIISIKTMIIDKNRPPIDISFKVRRNKNNEWKAFDLVAEGISLLDSKRTELSNVLRQEGIDHVIELLREKAKQPVQQRSLDS